MHSEEFEKIKKLESLLAESNKILKEIILNNKEVVAINHKSNKNINSKILELLQTDNWPEAVDPRLICDENSDEEKTERGESIAERFFYQMQNKKILDFGCGEGYVAQAISKNNFCIGYDLMQSGNLEWNVEKNNFILTNNFEKVELHGPYDFIFLYDVIDHMKDQSLDQIKKVSKDDTKIIVVVHPWCCRHGSHLYQKINKAFVHLVLNDQELSSLNITNSIFTNKIIYPLNSYRDLFLKNNLKIIEEEIERTDMEDFFIEHNIIKERIMSHWKRKDNQDFPKFQMEQTFINFTLEKM